MKYKTQISWINVHTKNYLWFFSNSILHFAEIILHDTKHPLKLFQQTLSLKNQLQSDHSIAFLISAKLVGPLTKMKNLIHGWFVCIRATMCPQWRKHSSQKTIGCTSKLIALNILDSQSNFSIVYQCCKLGTVDGCQKFPLLTKQTIQWIEPCSKPCPCPSQTSNAWVIICAWIPWLEPDSNTLYDLHAFKTRNKKV